MAARAICVSLLLAMTPCQAEERRLMNGRPATEAQQARTASCIIDIQQAMTYLAQAGTAIDQSTRKCTRPKPYHPEGGVLCAVSITEIIESFTFAASFLSSVGTDCVTGGPNVQAQCASDITGLIAAVSDLAQAGSGIDYDCTTPTKRRLGEANDTSGDEVVAYELPSAGTRTLLETRQLWSPERFPVWSKNPAAAPYARPPVSKQSRAERNYHAETAYCVIYAAQATWFLARAGLDINDATYDCAPTTMHSRLKTAACSASVSGVILSFSYVASYISGAAAQCTHGMNPQAACAGDITKLVAALATVAAASSGMSAACVVPPSRRLSEAAAPVLFL